MYKKILAGICLIMTGSSVFAADNYNLPFRGFQNIQDRMKLDVVNKLQAIADNDGVSFTKLWPNEYFQNIGNPSFIYIAKNREDITDIIKFEYSVNNNECWTKDNPEFCIQKLNPIKESYVYNERLIVERTPDFISKPNEKEVSEVLLKNSKYFDTKPIKTIKPKKEDQINLLRDCQFDEYGILESCQTFNRDTEDLLYTEELIRKEPITSAEDNIKDKLLKYVKYDSEDNKIEEYIYSNGKHTFYNKDGEVKETYQLTKNKFKYYNKALPDLCIDVDFVYDENERLIKEIHYDKNHKIIRKYSAEYDNGKISKIHVEDMLFSVMWDIIPIEQRDIKVQAFSIRY